MDIFDSLSFSMSGSATAVEKVSADRMSELVLAVLKKRFPGDPHRQEIWGKGGARLNVSCPYCGDSRDHRKKRGNVYSMTGGFKCFNGGCEKYTSVLYMLKDFDCMSELKPGEEVALKLIMKEGQGASRTASKIRAYEMNVDAMTGTDFSKVLIRRDDFMRAVKLWEIYPNSPCGTYLRMRGQVLDQKFAWDNWKKRIFIFNLDKTKEWIFSMQVTYLDRSNVVGSKYKTYRCGELWSTWMKSAVPAEVAAVDHLSQFFGVLQVNFSKPVTIFEGPMDHFLFPNSVATCGTNFEWPFQLDNDRHLQDNDDAGRGVAQAVLADGGRVFMWKKFLEHHGMTNHIKDWNDVVKWEMKTGRAVSVEEFFTDSALDMIFV